MDINATLIGQAFGFLILVWFTWKFIWPPLLGAIEERQKKIADGLAAADRGQKDLDEAKTKANEIVREARDKAVQVVDQAHKRSGELIDEAKHTAVAEGERLVSAARAEVASDYVAPDIAYVARLGLLAEPARSPARPMYLRPVDAKPQTAGASA